MSDPRIAELRATHPSWSVQRAGPGWRGWTARKGTILVRAETLAVSAGGDHLANVRVGDDPWEPATARADRESTTMMAVIVVPPGVRRRG